MLRRGPKLTANFEHIAKVFTDEDARCSQNLGKSCLEKVGKYSNRRSNASVRFTRLGSQAPCSGNEDKIRLRAKARSKARGEPCHWKVGDFLRGFPRARPERRVNAKRNSSSF